MAVVNEQIVTGRKFRKLIDEASRLWLRISFWTKACDVEFDDGENAETKFSSMTKKINDLIKSFQDGVNKIFNYLKGLGFTPDPNSPDGICSAIQNMYNKRYSDGRTQGQEDVKANPEAYGVSIRPKAFLQYLNWYEKTTSTIYTCPVAGNYTALVNYICENTHSHNAVGNEITLIMAGTEYRYYLGRYNFSKNSWEEFRYKNSGEAVTQYCPAGSQIQITVEKSVIFFNDNDTATHGTGNGHALSIASVAVI